MVTQTRTFENRAAKKRSLLPGRRILYILLVCGIQAIYAPTSDRMAGGIEPRLPFESYPIWPVWVVPYLLCYFLWFYSLAWVIFKTDDLHFRSFLMAFFITCTVSVMVFLVFPTYVREAELVGTDIFTQLLRYIHVEHGRYNALPSGHIYLTALIAFFFSRWHSHQKPFWVLVIVTVSLSTLFTGQHYVVDIVGGLLVAYVGTTLGTRWAGISSPRAPAAKPSLLQPPRS